MGPCPSDSLLPRSNGFDTRVGCSAVAIIKKKGSLVNLTSRQNQNKIKKKSSEKRVEEDGQLWPDTAL